MPATFLILIAAAALGCNRGPSRIAPPSIDAGDAADAALELYDADGDGLIAGDELDAAPAIKAAMKQLDGNADGKVDRAEIVQRVEAWEASSIGLLSVRCLVKLNGQPLPGAEIVFEPEPYLADSIAAARGKTNQFGRATISIPKADRPTADAPPGARFGLYRVRISKTSGGQEQIPAEYNTETTLGQEVSFEDAGVNSQIVYELNSR